MYTFHHLLALLHHNHYLYCSTLHRKIFLIYHFVGQNNAHFYIDNTRLGAINSSTTSDYRIKRDITTLAVDGIERVKKLRPVTFKYRDYDIYKQSEAVHEGFIAHEVGEVIPDACKGTKDEGLQLLEIAPIVSTLTKALQEAVAKIETLETKVAALEAG